MADFRILVTGSRDWDDDEQIVKAIVGWMMHARKLGRPLVIVHGDCPTGADHDADLTGKILRSYGYRVTVETHPADWDAHGKSAGFLRNAEMVNRGANVCLAFIGPCGKAAKACPEGQHGSHGATHCSDLAENAGIPTYRWSTWGKQPPAGLDRVRAAAREARGGYDAPVPMQGYA